MLLVMRAFPLLAALAVPSQARNTQPVVLATSFENESWFPLMKKEMERSMVDTALQELTGANLIELTDEGDVMAGRLEIEGALVERAETGKVTITFKAHKVASLVTTASVSLHAMNHDGIFRAMSGVGREAGKKMRDRLLAVIPPDKADIALVQMLGKDWDNRTTGDLYGKADDLKRAKRFDEAKEIFKVVAQRKDRGSQQWKRLADDELDFGLPMFEANQELIAAAEYRRQVDLDKIEKLYRRVLDKNKANEARVAEAQRGLDTVQQLRSAMGIVDPSEIKSHVRALQVAMVSQFMEVGQAPSLFANADVNNFKVDVKFNDYSFEIANKKTGFSALVKGNMMRLGGEELQFKEAAR